MIKIKIDWYWNSPENWSENKGTINVVRSRSLQLRTLVYIYYNIMSEKEEGNCWLLAHNVLIGDFDAYVPLCREEEQIQRDCQCSLAWLVPYLVFGDLIFRSRSLKMVPTGSSPDE